jgi:hypothetical protein
VEGQLHKKSMKEVHEGWAHYPKDQRKFRTKISERFFFPQISEVTREFINTCEGCRLEKAGVASQTDRDLHHTPPTRPYFRVHVDLCGPFRNQANKKRYIFVCIDAMLIFVSAKVIRNKEAVTVAQAFEEEILNRHSCPFEVITDQGTEFNQKSADRLQKAGAKHIRISPRNPKANRQVERMMKIIKSTLRIMCRKNPREWKGKVAGIVSEYNATYHHIIKMSPFMLLFGRRPVLPANHLFPSKLSAAVGQPIDDSLEGNQRRVRDLLYLQERTIDVIEQSHRKKRENYAKWNLKKRPRTRVLNEGNQAALLKSEPTRGFDLHWKGPYEFVKWFDPPENRQAHVKNAQGRILKRRAEEIVKFRQKSEFWHKVIEPLNPAVQVQDDEPLAVEQDLEDKTREVAPEFHSERHSEYLRLDKWTRRARNWLSREKLNRLLSFGRQVCGLNSTTNLVSIQNPSFFKQELLG